MDKKSNVRIVGFPKEDYDKEWLDILKDRELSDAAIEDGDTQIYVDLKEFQESVLNSPNTEELNGNWWYFLND